MPTLSVELTPEAGVLLESKMATGEYADESELVNEAILSLDGSMYEMKMAHLKQLLAEGIAQAERGEFVEYSLETIRRKALARIEARNA